MINFVIINLLFWLFIVWVTCPVWLYIPVYVISRAWWTGYYRSFHLYTIRADKARQEHRHGQEEV